MSDEESNWYAVKIFNNRRPQSIIEAINPDDYYIPIRHIARTNPKTGRLDVTQRVAESLMLVRLSDRRARALRQSATRPYMFYEDIDADGHRYPRAIPDKQVEIFRLVTSVDDTGLEYFGPDDAVCYAPGRRVRVTAGPFAGAEGVIKRVRGQRRLLVSIDGICAVATSYIPAPFLKPV